MINDISEIPQIDFAVVIINVDTKVSTTLALLSANRYMKNAKIVLADCSKNADELEYFKKLNSLFDFYLLKLPLKVHGKTIDFFFKNLNAKKIMLLDSDAELLTDKFFGMEYLDDDEVFGCGFFHEPHLMNNQTMRGGKFHLYQERMYIPCVILDAEKTRKAILSIGGGGQNFCSKESLQRFSRPICGISALSSFCLQIFPESRHSAPQIVQKKILRLPQAVHGLLRHGRGNFHVSQIQMRFEFRRFAHEVS